MKKLIGLLFFSLLLCGCAGLADYDIDLPGDYSVIRTSADNVIIAPKVGSGTWGETVIPTKVLEVGWNNNFIIAKQEDISINKKNYWIINIELNEIEGPLESQDFEKKLLDYNIKEIELLKIEDLKK